MSEYTEQANKFLADHGMTFTYALLRRGLYFPDDKETRNIYRMFIDRDGKQYSTSFGDSINNTKNGIEPTAYDLLACITKGDPGSFAEFCGDFGYKAGPAARKIYHNVKEDWKKVSEFFTAEEIEQLQEIS